MRSYRRTRNRLMNEINVVPYIDVMLVLLVIFMVTAPMMNPGQIDLPSVGKSAAPPVAPIEVIINQDASLSFRDHSKGGGAVAVSREDLVVMLKRVLEKNHDQSVVISADKKVRYEEVVNVMDMLQQQDIQKIGLLTKVK